MKKILIPLLVIMLIASFSVSALAADSAEATTAVGVTVTVETGEGEVEKTEKEDGTVTITAKPTGGGSFIRWVIEGEYQLITGKLDDEEITIRPFGDVEAKASFTGVATTTSPGSTSEESPKTGNDGVLYVGLAMLAAGAVIVLAKKHLITE